MFTRAFEFQKLCRENLKILLRTSCLIELILDCFEPQFNHTVFIFHTLKWDLLNFRSFVGEAENIVKEFLSDWACYNYGLFQWSSICSYCLYLPYFNTRSFEFQQLKILLRNSCLIEPFLKLNLIILCFIYHTVFHSAKLIWCHACGIFFSFE